MHPMAGLEIELFNLKLYFETITHIDFYGLCCGVRYYPAQ